MPSMPLTTAPFDRTALSASVFRMLQEYQKVYEALRGELTALAQDPTRSVTMAEMCAETLLKFHITHLALLKDDILQGNRRWQQLRPASQKGVQTRRAQREERNAKWVLDAFAQLRVDPKLGPWAIAGRLERMHRKTPYKGSQKAIWAVLRAWNVWPPKLPRS